MNARGLLTIALGLAATTACLPDPVCATLSQPISGTGINGQGIAGLMAFVEDDCGTFNPCNCTLTDGFVDIVQVDVMPADNAAARAAFLRGRVDRVVSEGNRWALETPAGPHLVCGAGADTCVGVVVAEGEVSTVHFIAPNAFPNVVEGGEVIRPPTFLVGEMQECSRDEDCGDQGVCYDITCRRDPACSDDDVETPCDSPCRGRCFDPASLGYCTSDDDCPEDEACNAAFPEGVCLVDRRPDSDGSCVGLCGGGCSPTPRAAQDPATGECFQFADSCAPAGFPPCE